MTPLRVLIIEDSADDEVMTQRALRRGGGFDVQSVRVDTREAMRAALDRQSFDVIISDHRMPRFSSLEALEEVRQRALDTPFIIVSGTIGEELAVQAMKSGAHDYVMKENLARLAPAVARELREAESRRVRRWTEQTHSFLSEASHALSLSLDLDLTSAEAVRWPVPFLAELVVLALDGAGHQEPRFEVHAAGAWSELAAELRRDPAGYQPASAPPLAPQLMARARALGMVGWTKVPLTSRGAEVGALVLLSTRHRYADSELWVVRDFASRVSTALDNALLYLQAQRALTLRDDFLAIAAHELFTPLTSLKLALQSMRARTEGGPAVAGGVSFEMVLRQIDRLARLVESLLDVTRIQRGVFTLSPEALDLGELVEEVVGRFTGQMDTAGSEVRVQCERPVDTRVDRLRMEQLVSNLLSNALKYGEGKPIEVALRSNGRWAELSVGDHGIGIEQARQADIFEMYGRAVSRRHYGGLGLGLYLVRQIAGLHGGTAEVQSEPGKGAVFRVRMPVVLEAEAQPEERAAT